MSNLPNQTCTSSSSWLNPSFILQFYDYLTTDLTLPNTLQHETVYELTSKTNKRQLQQQQLDNNKNGICRGYLA